MNTNLFYFKQLNSIGGIETFFYNLAQKYGKEFDITILYKEGNKKQVERLSKLVRMRKYKDGERVRCKRAFCAFNTDILDYIDADEYYQVLHGDYRALGVLPMPHQKLQKYVACSQVVSDAYADITGKVAEVAYNPVVVQKPRKALRLISATRLTPDKGWNRMLQLAKALDEAGVPYQWDIYTDMHKPIDSPNITLHKPRLDVINFVAAADYFVQLSDAEGYCYSVVESLCAGTPVIVTDFQVAHEIGVVNGKNGWILPMDMSNLPIEDICKGVKKFKYTPLEDRWGEYLLPIPPTYEEEMNQIVKVRCKRIYFDLEFKRQIDAGEEWKCTRRRGEMLEDLNLVDIIEE